MQQDSIEHSENPYQSSVVQDDVVRDEYGTSETDLSETAEILRQTRPWLLLIGVFGILMTVVPILVMILSHFFAGGGIGVPGIAELLILVVFGAMFVVPLVLMFRYAQCISRFVAQPNMVNLLSALRPLRTFWRFAGGIVLAIVVLYILSIVGWILYDR
jgi:hypothetical protein